MASLAACSRCKWRQLQPRLIQLTHVHPFRYFDALNRRDLTAAIDLFSDDCRYNNLAMEQGAQGKGSLSGFFQATMSSVPEGATFVIDDMTQGDSSKVGVVW